MAEQSMPTPPAPGNLPPKVEEARAHQAIEAVLEKYLRYWGPRYRVAPVEVTVEGEWAYGVAQWQSGTRTLEEPIYILAHRLADGIWQALMPSSEGLYLQWVEEMPESLVPSSERSNLHTQAIAAEALQRPQATPVVPLPVSPIPRKGKGPSEPVSPIPRSALPTVTPAHVYSSTTTQSEYMTIPATVLLSPFSNQLEASSCTSLANWQCVETRPGLSLCRANNICVVKVNLNSNNLRPQVAIAPNGGTAWLSSMAAGAGALAAINGDYFSGCPDTVPPLNCGEGLTFVDGSDYTDYTGSEWQNRRSLGFSDGYDPNIGRPGEQGGYHRQLLGGGPQVTFGGEYQWRCWYQSYNTDGNCACQDNTVVINDELFGCSANNWWNRPQSFVGFSDDRNTLYLAVSEPGYNKTPQDMHDVLWVIGARHSLKLDGGGSSGMYFNDGGYQFSWNGGREVANSWVIVPDSSPPPPPPTGNWEARYDQGSTLWWNPDAHITPRCTETINGPELHKDWGSDAPCGGMDGDDWVGDFNATINFSAGEYVFHLDHDDGVKLWLNGQNIQERGGSGSGPVCNGSGGYNLDSNENLRVLLREDGGDAHIHLTWSTDTSVCNPPPSCNPNSDQVALYADTGYGGSCVTLDIGDYPNPGYLGGLGNDNAESIKVGSNVQATLYEHDDYQGRPETFTNDDPNLDDNYIGANVVSSVKVQSRDTTPPTGQITSPSDGAVISACPLTIQAEASDDQSGVSHVEFHAYYNDSWHHLGDDYTSPYSWNWDCSSVSDQDIVLTIHIWDNAGNEVMDPGGYVDITLSLTTTGPLVYDSHVVDDDNNDQSSGDGDGVVECGETIELYVTLRNQGNGTATGVNSTISTDDPYVTWLYNTDSGYPDISGGGTGINSNDFDFAVDSSTPNGHMIQFNLDSNASNGGPWADSFSVSVACHWPDLVPSQWGGWQYPVVPSSITGTSVVNTLYAGPPTYIDWGLTNRGAENTGGNTYGDLYIDDVRIGHYDFGDVLAGHTWAFFDWGIIVDTPGWHTLKSVVDPDNLITESDETNNVWEHQFYWETTCGDPCELNNDPSQATDIAYAETLSGYICPEGDEDFFRFAGSAGDKVVIDIDARVNGSSLDSYVFLFDSDGTTVLAQNDDEASGRLDSHFSHVLPHDGIYYVKVREYSHPNEGGAAYFYTIHLLTDDISPSAEITSPGHDSWLNPNLQTITTDVSDGESGIRNVVFYWHDADWDNSDWIVLEDDWSSDDWTYEFDTSGIPEQPQDSVVFIYAYDWAGNYAGYGSYHLGLDRTAPTGSILIQGDAEVVTDTQVTLTLNASDAYGVPYMRLRYGSVAWSTWEPYATNRAWMLPTREGEHTVGVQFQDPAGNVSAAYSDSVIYQFPCRVHLPLVLRNH
jgi:hypothetical protein